jgi:hypothetical protein
MADETGIGVERRSGRWMMRTCGDYDLRSTSVRAGDGRADFVRCGAIATHRVGSVDVCDVHLEKRKRRGDDLRDAMPISPASPLPRDAEGEKR